MEKWKTVDGYDGMYEVSEKGEVRSNIKGKIKILKPYMIDGYKHVHLKRKNVKIHRLVAMAFIPNPNNYDCVNHKDYDRSNNNVDNLEWCTKRYNAIYSRERFKKPHTVKAGISGEKYIRETARGTYKIQIRISGKLCYNRTFKNKEDAIINRDQILREYEYV